MTMIVTRPGVHSLLQDSGRFGMHRMGLTNGGPIDVESFNCCNLLLQNTDNCTLIEISIGGFGMRSQCDNWICLTGADMPLTINGEEADNWTVHRVGPGDEIAVGYARSGCRAYLGVAGGFAVEPVLGSTATVAREGIGGLAGTALAEGDELPCGPAATRRLLHLPAAQRPRFQSQATVRVVPGYQIRQFNRTEQRRFFGAPYTVSEHSDRMGYRLEGSPVQCTSAGISSEGICLGAVQIPPDGQPIVLLNDRQTIGGYPKIGAALSLDLAKLGQLTAGATVHFAPITPATARRALQIASRFGPTPAARDMS